MHEQQAVEVAGELSGLDTIWIIGGGPSHGTARYCAAKFHEQLPWNGIPEDLEEWAHLQYFLTLSWNRRSTVIVIAPPGNSLDRAEELVEGIAGAGGRAIVVAHQGHGEFPLAANIFQMPAFLGKTNSISSLKSALDQPEFATAIGLVKFGSLQQKRKPSSGLAGGIRKTLTEIFRK